MTSQSSLIADQWQTIDSAPRDGSTFLAVNSGEIERWCTTREGAVVTVRANNRPFTCSFFEGDEYHLSGFIDEFGEQYGHDGLVFDAEDMSAADGVLRLTNWMPLPSPPRAKEDGNG